MYSAGDTISFAGTATDAEDGALPPSAFSWTILFHHRDHTHPFMGPINGVTGGSFTVPTLGETDSNVWYRIYLTVTDSAGFSTTTYRNVFPRTVTLTLLTNPSGLQIVLDGQPLVTPATILGSRRVITVPPGRRRCCFARSGDWAWAGARAPSRTAWSTAAPDRR